MASRDCVGRTRSKFKYSLHIALLKFVQLYTFYDDLHGNALVIKCVLSVSQLMHKAFNNANKFAGEKCMSVPSWRLLCFA